jgi:diguanylate cyclase (GGDEF)-like protein
LILIVDDEPVTRIAFARALGDLGEIVVAEGVSDAKARWATRQPDLALVDKVLADGDGKEVVGFAQDTSPHVPVIMMSAYASVDSVIEAIRANVIDYLVKPVDPENLVERCSRALRLGDIRRTELTERDTIRNRNKLLEKLVVRDPLTGLYNHGFLHERLEEEVRRAERSGADVAFALVDIDHFKPVNDSLGHQAGDRVIKVMADVLTGRYAENGFRLRSHDIAARYGGDEFALIFPDTDKRGAAVKCERLRAFLETFRFPVDGLSGQTISVGISSYPEDATEKRNLIAHADSALQVAKRKGRNRVIGYAPHQPETGTAHLKSSGVEIDAILKLHEVIEKREFGAAFQPIVHSGTGEVYGYEALCRPRAGTFPHPGALFEAAERSGRVVDLGQAVRAVQLEALETLPHGCSLFLNLHPLELNDTLLLQMQQYADQASSIVLEITETAVVRQTDRLRDLMGALREIGFRFALDDLGSGYAGLNSLAILEPEIVKLDMELIRGVDSKGRQARLVRHIAEYADGEGILVVAEGVETEAELAVVIDVGVSLAQGYYFAKPGPAFPDVDPRER